METRLLSDVKIVDMETLERAIETIHQRYGVPHIIITSVSLAHPDHPSSSLSVVGSTMTSTRHARPFKIVFPAIDAYFSGTGDMFAALTVVRMREAIMAAPGLKETPSWISSDDVAPTELPLAKAAEKVLGSMHEVLEKTSRQMEEEMQRVKGEIEGLGLGQDDRSRRLHLLQSRANELRLVRNLESLRNPTVEFRARRM
jgi:pyridoxine kinase